MKKLKPATRVKPKKTTAKKKAKVVKKSRAIVGPPDFDHADPFVRILYEAMVALRERVDIAERNVATFLGALGKTEAMLARHEEHLTELGAMVAALEALRRAEP